MKVGEYRAIGWYAQDRGWKMALSAYPYIYFTTPDNETERAHIDNIIGAYNRHIKEEAQERLVTRQRARANVK